MSTQIDILCIGSVLWDVIGKAEKPMPFGADVPGHITRQPGGVALNIAMTLTGYGLRPALLSAVGTDPEGDELIARAQALGLETGFLHRTVDRPTDRYMAIEDSNGLVAAIADAHSLEAAGDAILAPLADGRLGAAQTPFSGFIALDGNLTQDLLAEIAESPLFAQADLRLAPASPGKAKRLRPLLGHPNATFYVNIEEAGLLCGTRFVSSRDAARGLLAVGAARALVTAGADEATDGTADGLVSLVPPQVQVRRITGAGDSFMAAHIAAEQAGAQRDAALLAALQGAARHISQG